jgi:hypothetical protein
MQIKPHIPILASFVFVACATVPEVVDAAFTSLSPNLPIVGRIGENPDMTVLLNGFFVVAIALSALLAVIMVAIGGFEYMTTDSVFKMGNAKERISNAIIGLLIVLTAVLVLRTINPCLVTLSLFQGNTTCINPTP